MKNFTNSSTFLTNNPVVLSTGNEQCKKINYFQNEKVWMDLALVQQLFIVLFVWSEAREHLTEEGTCHNTTHVCDDRQLVHRGV